MFQLVFLIKLRFVAANPSLAETIKYQHNLEHINADYIDSILQGKTKHKVLLMLDGYDEYKRGTNVDIDTAILKTIGNCFMILTSRPADRMSKPIRDLMDGEIVIEGFSKESIIECSTKFLKSKENSDEMLRQAKETGIDVLLHIPIILVMTIVIFIEGKKASCLKNWAI